MAGPMVTVNTQTYAITLNVNRLLNMGSTAQLQFGVPDGEEADGVRVLRTYTQNFDRISGDEVGRGDGATIIFHLADTYPIPLGQLRADLLGQKSLLVRAINADPNEWCKVNSVASLNGSGPPASNEAQIYVVTAAERQGQKTYFGR